MWITGIVMACDMALIMGSTARYVQTENKTGQGFTIGFIFCFSVIYSLGYNSIHYICVPEIMSQAIRARGYSVSSVNDALATLRVHPTGFSMHINLSHIQPHITSSFNKYLEAKRSSDHLDILI
ncbi:hypothetical protein FPV67DRAFT_1451326 [Lyophyllum atratum]|nr:hypothetical protein FPV67DRAFT_1451326 [Lyophyllum atratum]